MAAPVLTEPRVHDEPRLQADPGKAARERRFRGLLVAMTGVSVAVLAWLLVDIITDGVPRMSGAIFTDYLSTLRPETSGLREGITGTLSLMVLVAAMAFPLGVAAALYLEEFAAVNRFTKLVETNINNLAGVPSVVYGLLGFGIFVQVLPLDRWLIVGAMTLTLLILPVIIVASREALRAVPQDLRSAGLALGATPIQVAFTITLPAAISGILTGTILALSRAIGETAPILVVGAAFSRRADTLPIDLTEGYAALPVQIYQLVTFPQPEFARVAAAGIVVLLAALLTMNSVAIYLRNRYSKER